MPDTTTLPDTWAGDEIKGSAAIAERNRELRVAYLSLNDLDTIEARNAKERIANEAVTLNQGLVRSVWSKYRSVRGADSDLLAAGQVGLWEAFLSWDVDKAPFASWAWRHIDGRIRRQVAADDFSGSYLDWSRRPAVTTATTKLRKKLDREPTDAEIAAECDLTVDAVKRTKVQRSVSIEHMIEVVGGAAEELISDAAGETIGSAADDVDVLKRLTGHLTAAQLAVVIRTRGEDGIALDGGPVATIATTAAALGYNREGMRERLVAGLNKMRTASTPH